VADKVVDKAAGLVLLHPVVVLVGSAAGLVAALVVLVGIGRVLVVLIPVVG
jgi:hypothetical protein